MYGQFRENTGPWNGPHDDAYLMGYSCGFKLYAADPSTVKSQQWKEHWYMGYRDAVADLGYPELAEAHLNGEDPARLFYLLQGARESEEGKGLWKPMNPIPGRTPNTASWTRP